MKEPYIMKKNMKIVLINDLFFTAYAPMVFDVFLKPEWYHGSSHIFTYAKRSKACLNIEQFTKVKEYFLINGWWFHPENVLACALVSPESTPQMKKKALKIILEARARERAENTGEIRYFINPKEDQLNFDAPNFLEVLRWNQLPLDYITPPPLFKDFSDDELRESIKPKGKPLNIPRFLCHSQHCEGCILKTTKSVTKNIGYANQKSSIIGANSSREKYPHPSRTKKLKKEDFLS